MLTGNFSSSEPAAEQNTESCRDFSGEAFDLPPSTSFLSLPAQGLVTCLPGSLAPLEGGRGAVGGRRDGDGGMLSAAGGGCPGTSKASGKILY